ncbi:hypothetical protein EWM64_g84 [Hericium alpestre]|uniref:BHLH domain-containing protein n=1 Tax=Hericium alpestre TaxID=135208 RepID=A0A4Z0ABC9_9AGAM|nr:hypothetical protein EWM64_g84 [Hericium alpestre]
MATETTNEYCESDASLAGLSCDTQSAGLSSESQLHHSLYPASIQPDLQADESYRGTPTAYWSSSASYNILQWSSISYESGPAEQDIVTTAASSSNPIQPIFNSSPPSLATPIEASQLAASTSRFRLREDSHSFSTANEIDMQGKMGRWRIAPPSPALGEKRKKRTSPTPPPTPDVTSDVESLTSKKARARTAAAMKSAKHRESTNYDMAKLAALLPRHLQLYEPKPSVRYVKQAITYIEELNDRIKRLKDEAAELAAALTACLEDNQRMRSERDGLLCERYALHDQIGKLLIDSNLQRNNVVEKD